MSSIYDKASLVLIPSGTKTSKVYSQKPVNGDGDFTFSRSTAATRVNADGNIEKETQNLLLQSNSFDTTWGNSSTTETSGQSGYDGTNNAWLLSKSAASGYIVQFVSVSGVQTFSVYVKANASTWGLLQCIGGSNPYAYFNLDTGVVGSIGGGTISSSIEDVGGDWYRISMIHNTTISSARIYPAESNTASGTSGSIYIQDAQLEQGLVARDYIETTTAAVEGGITDNVPRLDYTDSSCPALLLEPQRSNLITNSEYISGWVGANTTPVANTGISPEGVSNATSITFASGGYWYQAINLSYTSGQTFVWSIYVNTSTRVIQWGGATPSGTSTYEIIDAGNGWYRQILTRTTSGSGTSQFQTLMDSVYIGVGVEFKVYGAQLEAGSYATSYIPTYGTSVTRNADSGQVMNLDTNNIVGGSQWTFFAELEVHNNTPNADKMALTDADSMPRTYLYNTTLGWAGGWTGSSYNLDLNTNSKVAWRLNDSRNGDIFANGALRASITNQSVDMTADRIFLRGAQGKWRLRQIILFPTALTDQELIDLTTL